MFKVICNNGDLHYLGRDVSGAWLTNATRSALAEWTICLFFPHTMVARAPLCMTAYQRFLRSSWSSRVLRTQTALYSYLELFPLFTTTFWETLWLAVSLNKEEKQQGLKNCGTHVIYRGNQRKLQGELIRKMKEVFWSNLFTNSLWKV